MYVHIELSHNGERESSLINFQSFPHTRRKLLHFHLLTVSGVQSAMQHDTIMSSANPDYVLVEGEAQKVAESAVKALKASRRQCQQSGGGARRWGQPTWTGQHGSIGAPKPLRYGTRTHVHACACMCMHVDAHV